MRRYEERHIEFIRATSNLLSSRAYEMFCSEFPDFKVSYMAFAEKKHRIGACKAKSKKYVWTEEMLEFVRGTVGQDRDEAYEEFRKKFCGITATAFHNQRSRLGVSPRKPHGSNKRTKLYDERVKSGYVIIKVAEPGTWKSKARWVWEETHPGELTRKSDNFIFLNGNRRDFRPENIERLESRYRILFQQFGGADSDPNITRIRLMQARMKVATLDLGEKIGTVKVFERKRGKRIYKTRSSV